MAEDMALQYLRSVKLLIVATGAGTGSPLQDPAIDLSLLRIKFAVKRSDTMTPNMADIRVYNVETQTGLAIKALENVGQVILEAGYQGNHGVIFRGNIKQVIIGRESATDTFIDIIAGDGDRAYNFSVVNTTIQSGATQADQVTASIAEMSKKGVTAGNVGDMPTEQLPRGKVMFGNARNYLRNVAQTASKYWSIQDEKVTFVSQKGYLPGEAVLLNSETGMIGTPQQTNEGVNTKCLLNPLIRVGGRIKIDNNVVIDRMKINLAIKDPKQIAASIPAWLRADGTYYVLVIEHQGDTRGVDWYTSLICLNIDVTTNPANSVQVGYGN